MVAHNRLFPATMRAVVSLCFLFSEEIPFNTDHNPMMVVALSLKRTVTSYGSSGRNGIEFPDWSMSAMYAERRSGSDAEQRQTLLDRNEATAETPVSALSRSARELQGMAVADPILMQDLESRVAPVHNLGAHGTNTRRRTPRDGVLSRCCADDGLCCRTMGACAESFIDHLPGSLAGVCCCYLASICFFGLSSDAAMAKNLETFCGLQADSTTSARPAMQIMETMQSRPSAMQRENERRCAQACRIPINAESSSGTDFGYYADPDAICGAKDAGSRVGSEFYGLPSYLDPFWKNSCVRAVHGEYDLGFMGLRSMDERPAMDWLNGGSVVNKGGLCVAWHGAQAASGSQYHPVSTGQNSRQPELDTAGVPVIPGSTTDSVGSPADPAAAVGGRSLGTRASDSTDLVSPVVPTSNTESSTVHNDENDLQSVLRKRLRGV